ncbi:collagen alpha-1(XII) chain-like [Mercenaria mercenaria]|uniref:collagen alpha-1(XII) chain-like n=1 Tax=Mercenaria mercenaria TaxID=6596 RepID=UPI00234F4CCF|nr:collagen alpha-1(XII) chain-like [Mercenaria mercenaria]
MGEPGYLMKGLKAQNQRLLPSYLTYLPNFEAMYKRFAICSPSCLNGGTCTSPGTCKCDVYHSGGRCQTELACTNKTLELVFLLDSSGGIGKANFETLKSFVKTIIEQFDIAGHKTRVGMMTFSRYPFMRFSINDNKSMSQLLQEVDNVPYISGLTETHTALQLLQQEGFLGSRSRVPHVALLITEGKSLHPNETKAVADAIRKQGIVMFVIAIGERVSREELRIIATDPDDKHLFFVHNHTAIDGIKDNITTLICDGLRETDRALQMLRLEGFENDRPEAPNIAILITNGPSSNSFLTQRAANELKQSGVEVFTVDDIEGTELELISTSGGNHTFTAPNYLEFDLSSFEGIVASAVCQGLPVPTTPTTTTTSTTSTSRPTTRTTTYSERTTNKASECVPDVKDVIFLVDSSGSIGDDNFNHIKEFIKQTIKTFDIGLTRTRVGLILFNSHATMIFPLDKYDTRHDLLNAVENIVYSPGGTNTGAALELLRTQGFKNDRPNAPNIAFLITDGYSTDKNATMEQAALAKENNQIQVVATGIGQLLDMQELSDIASANPSTNRSLIYHVDDFDELHVFSLEKILASVICGIELSSPSSSTATPLLPVTHSCFDEVDNCVDYDQDMCTSYRPWAMAHCKRYCGFCQGAKTPPQPCVDKKSNCDEYGQDICIATAFRKWTRENCARFCGICHYTTTTVSTTSPPLTVSPVCADEEDNCDEYDPDMCTKYQSWAKANCKRFCGYCQGVPTPTKPCVDTIGNCREYGHEICTSASFRKWTKEHCARFCEFCGVDATSTTTASPPTNQSTATTTFAVPSLSSCYDKERNCESYGGHDMCTSYRPWAMANCEQYCGFCEGPTTPPKPCVDEIENCREYGHDLCSSPSFSLWVKRHCARFCEICDADISSNASSPVPVTKSSHSSMTISYSINVTTSTDKNVTGTETVNVTSTDTTP